MKLNSAYIVLKRVHKLKLYLLTVSALTFLLFSTQSLAFRVLFIGNSFTRLSIPTLQGMKSVSPLGVDVFEYEFVDGSSLSDHVNRKETIDAINNGAWDYVVLQDHSRQTLDNHLSFDIAVRSLVSVIRKSGAEPILFATWARLEQSGYAPRQLSVIAAYRLIGRELNVSVADVGGVWLAMYNTNRSVFKRMFDEDGIHQTKLGAQAVGASLYKVMYDTDLSWAPGSQSIKSAALALNITRSEHLNSLTNRRIPPQMAALQAILSLLNE